jgi:hypothetical protein
MKPLSQVLLAGLLLLLTACDRAPVAAEPELQLRTYEVPSGYARELRNTLRDTFQLNGKEDAASVARVSLAPDGRLVVLAPPKLQEGVARILEEVARKPPPAPSSVQMTYWLVLGRRAQGEPGSSAALAEVQPALDELVKAQGPMRFELLERLQLATLSGERGSIDGRQAKISHDATTIGDGVMARIQLFPTGGNSVTTTVQLEPNQTAILAQSGYQRPLREQAEATDESATLLFVVRANPVHAPAQR